MSARQPDGSPPIPTRSIRVPDRTWNPAKERAVAEHETMTAALIRFLECYGSGGDVSCRTHVVPTGGDDHES
jgi:hypothetical protein